MKRIALLFFAFVTVATAQVLTTVDATGVGATHDLALNDAKRNAVEQGLGMVIASQTLVKNYQLANDKILAKANGFVKEFDIVSEKVEVDGSCTIAITAKVSEIVDQMLKDQLALDLLLEWMNRPKLMIMLNENNIGDVTTQVAETEMTRIFLAKHFDMVDRSQIDRIRSSEQAIKAFAGDAAAAAAIGADFGADLVITGKAKATIAEGMSAMLGGMHSGQADISARAIRTDVGSIMALATEHGKGVHISKNTAGTKALTQAGEKLASLLMKEMVKKWQLESSSTSTVQMIITDIAFAELLKLKKELPGALSAIQDVKQRSFAANTAKLDITCEGSAEQLAEGLMGITFDAFKLEITGMSAHKIDVRFIK